MTRQMASWQKARERARQLLGVYGAPARPWLALTTLMVLFSLPDAVRSATARLKQIRPYGDLLALLTLAAVAVHLGPRWRWARVLLASYATLLFLFSVDRMLMAMIMQEEPLLYDQLFMARHLLVLIGDLWSAKTAAAVAAALVVIGLMVWLARRMLRSARVLLEQERASSTLRVGLVIWLVALPLGVTDSLGITKFPVVRWASPLLADNVARSIATYRSVERGLAASKYASYDAIALTRKPDVDIFIVESYGRLLWEQANLRAKHLPVLEALEQRLSAAGWSAVSAFSSSPVRGARSWLADASMTLGSPIRYEAIYRHVRPDLAKRPSLVSFFRKQGYETFFVSPSSRARPGVRETEPFGYERFLELKDMAYKGPNVSWGVVPDQYSLSYVEERWVRPAKRPRFMTFHMVSSHAPWAVVPEKVADYRELNTREGARLKDKAQNVGVALTRFGFFDRSGKDIQYRPVKAKYVEGYVATIHYDLDLLTDLLARSLSKDRLVVWIGDHQPPLVSARNGSYDAPIHVLSRDPALLEEFRARGFVSGLRIPVGRPTTMSHAGMFSLLARSLARCCSATKPWPSFLPQGQQLLDADPSVSPARN